MRAALDACKTKEATLIAAPFNVAWTAAVIDAMMWPDIDLPLRYVKGFDVVFDVPDSGVFRQEFDPAEISKKTFMEGNTKMVAQISDEIKRSATEGDAQAREGRKQCWIRTKEEIEEGLVFGPYSRARMDKKYKRGRWRCLGRSAILQKGKFRCIDNGKRNKANKATTMHERITCGRADFPVMVAREFAKRRAAAGVRKKPPMKMQHGTSDLRAAYRRVPTRQPQFTCVAVWDDDAKKVAYCDVPGHNLGLKSAVVNFNRFPELAAVAARRLLWCVTEHYYDDNDSCEPSYAGTSGQDALIDLCGDDFFGFSFDPGKTESMEESNEYLGVVSDLSRVHEGVLMMDVSSKRRKKIKALTTEILQERKLRSGMAASIFGKSRFMLSPCFGSLGKACLQPIMARESTSATRATSPKNLPTQSSSSISYATTFPHSSSRSCRANSRRSSFSPTRRASSATAKRPRRGTWALSCTTRCTGAIIATRKRRTTGWRYSTRSSSARHTSGSLNSARRSRRSSACPRSGSAGGRSSSG